MTVGVLGGEGEEGGDPQRDPGGDSLWLDPEADPGHHHNQTGWYVGVEHEVSQPPPELELHHQTREVTRAVGRGAVSRGVVDQLQLGKLYWLHHKRYQLWRIPFKYQIICGVGHCKC